MFVPYHSIQTICGIPQPPIQWVLGSIFPSKSSWEAMLITHLHPISKVKKAMYNTTITRPRFTVRYISILCP
jgi:hypothetical protein